MAFSRRRPVSRPTSSGGVVPRPDRSSSGRPVRRARSIAALARRSPGVPLIARARAAPPAAACAPRIRSANPVPSPGLPDLARPGGAVKAQGWTGASVMMIGIRSAGGGVPWGLGGKKGQEPAQGMMRLRGNRLEL
jgi:hypothetical protein